MRLDAMVVAHTDLDRINETDPTAASKATGHFISKPKLTLPASHCRIIDTVYGSPSRHF